ncbi:MAG TPA: histidine--tRNA ligase [Gemmatimonadota bacterium]|nr:histidine--tRNA ligase [Gemmatimonadota bacterium]
MSRFEALPGTRDFYPPEMRRRTWIESRWREVALRYGFEEVDGPVIEPLELFTVKSGEEIVDQLYAFEDRGGRGVALRPEMTPTLARMVAARSQGIPKPIKWFSIPRLFRYERPQRGRFREFWQLNLDIFGVPGVEADAEIIAAGVDVLKACGLGAGDFVVRYSDRRLLDRALERLQVPADRWPGAFAALDKLLRSGPDGARQALARAGVADPAAATLVEAVGRRERVGFERALAAAGADVAVESAGLAALEASLEAYGVASFCAFDAAVVRGLAYYTGVVFEIYDRAGELRAICGGGRYDDLLEGVGGERLPAVGFGLGEAVLSELLERVGIAVPEDGRCEAYIIPVSAADRLHAISVAARLREAGVRTDLVLRDGSVGRGLKSAAQAGAQVAIVIGERERQDGTLTFRDLSSGDESTLGFEEAVTRLARRGDPA